MMKNHFTAYGFTAALILTTATANGQNRPDGTNSTGGGPVILSAAEKEILAEVEGDYTRYQEAASRHQKRITGILFREYENRKSTLEKRYTKKIAAASAKERKRRLEAIALLEKFVVDYPDSEKFTPDAMFRLADLYLDQSNEDFERAFDAQTSGLAALDDSIDEDAELVADYSKSVNLWAKIVEKFPAYRQRPGTLYLLAYYLKQTGEERRALQVARGLVCPNRFDPSADPAPPPNRAAVRAALAGGKQAVFDNPYRDCQTKPEDEEITQDAWVRIIGDVHFLTPGELPYAIVSYQKVAANDKSNFYDEALYKLAWSHYRNNDFIEGIAAFDQSIIYSDALVAQGKDPLELRPEALQYIAISFTDPWTDTEQPDPVLAFNRAMEFYGNRLDEPHVRDVFVQLGDTFELLETYTQAIDSWQIALKNNPLHPENPRIHQKIVSAYSALGERELADEAAAKMAETYAPGSDWYKANETNREAMALQAELGESILKSAAINMHRSAQEARQEYNAEPSDEKKAKYVALYRKAAGLYRRFITGNPTSKDAYEFTYFLGDALFWAEDYLDAIEHYRWVRDHRDLSEARFGKAALSIVQSYEKEIAKRVAKNEIAEPAIPSLDELKAMPKPVTATPIPPIYQDWQNALDEYQQLVNDPKSAPQMGYLAGVISYRFLNLPDAAKRFELTFTKFCGEENSVKAKDGLLAIYEATGQDQRFNATNDRFIEQRCGSEEDIRLAKAQNRSKKFREAEDLSTSGNFADAATLFYRYYKSDEIDDANKPVALYNSALNYDKAGKPKTAVYLYKEFTNNPSPRFRKSEYYLTALYLTAVSYNNAFDYKNAAKTYLEVADISGRRNTKAPQGIELSLKDIQLTSLYNAAVLRELDQVYSDPSGARGTGAISLYNRYASLTSDKTEKEKARWAVARIYRTKGDIPALSKAYGSWRKDHGRTPGNEDKYVFSYYNLSKEYEKKGQTRNARKAQQDTLKAWQTVGSPRKTPAADMAAEFAFLKAEAVKANGFDKFKITKAPKTKKDADKILSDLDNSAERARNEYKALSKYESGIWSLAGLVRIGDTFFFQGLKLKEAPTPKEIEKLDAKFPQKDVLLQYQDAIDAQAQPLIDQAAKQWEKVVSAGRQQGVANDWTQLAQERLHDFISQQSYPVLRQEIIEGTENP